MTDRLKTLADAGVSIWLDDLSRERLRTGNLEQLVKEKSVVGVTTNPSIFASALGSGDAYDEQLRELAGKGVGVDDAIFTITTDDVREACDVLAPVFSGEPADGRVSIEVDPGMARDADATEAQAQALWAAVDRPNAMIKIPATEEGLPAIAKTIGAGISVNVTLIFSIDRYRAVMDAYLTGLESAKEAGKDLSSIQSVASFFISRVDSEVDKRLDAVGTDEAAALKGKAALANARLAYAAYQEVFSSDRWQALADAGAHVQRPLWASTGVKNPDYPDTLYVTDLVVAGTVNTMPEKTMDAFADHGEVTGDQVTGRAEEAQQVFDALEGVGLDLADVYVVLENEGVDKFDDSWAELTQTVKDQLEKSA
ncbi:transaldolase [Nocardioides sp. CFH 31398]|uniref:transaldolase n=1 Tax=Nocardioides sp. CFH 31398 TaxID=2919579 RepID=UPI001F060175|nr:transaldolase [Nocardioides sp. CFH 31398]MCH1866742.1 transaldolase [Nocardioides sp. CFH 31398]